MAIKTASGTGSELDRILGEVGQPDARVLLYFFSAELSDPPLHAAVSASRGPSRATPTGGPGACLYVQD